MHDDEKSNALQKYCDVHNARLVKHVWQFFIMIHENVNLQYVYEFGKI